MCQFSDTEAQSIRKRIRHEELMIYNRIHWMLTFQGFLFASLAIISNTNADAHIRSVLLNTIPLLGAMAGLLAFIGIVGAYMHMHEIRRPLIKAAEDIGKDFGAAGLARWMGRANSGLLPVIIIFAWIKLYFELT